MISNIGLVTLMYTIMYDRGNNVKWLPTGIILVQ